jgi:hypothetical protein
MTRFWLAVSLFAFAGVAGATQTYPLKCRPGSETAFNLSVAGELRFGFQRAPVAAGANGATLSPGECAWVDRPVSAGEPSFVAAPFSGSFKVGAVVPHAFNDSFKAYIYAAQQQWVSDFSQKDVILTLYVYNDGNFLRAPNP